jgi:hypothetical protein
MGDEGEVKAKAKAKKLFYKTENGIEMKNLHFDVFVVFVLQFHIVTGVFAEQDFVADLQELRRICAILADAAFADGNDETFLGLFAFGRIRDHDT